MLNLAKFTVGDLFIQELPDPTDPSTKIARRGIIKKVDNTTLVVKWTKDSRFPDPGENEVRMLTQTVRTMIMNGSVKHFASKK